MDIFKRSINALGWAGAANAISLLIFFVRTIILVRWIPDPAVWGIFTAALALVSLSIALPNFGMGPAFLHRTPETEDEQDAAAAHFTLLSMLLTVWAVVAILLTLILTQGDLQAALLFLIPSLGATHLARTGRLILVRRVAHRRLALITLVNAIISTAVSLTLAGMGKSLSALLYPYAFTALATLFFHYVWRPVWRPRFCWAPQQFRYFIAFGRDILLADFVERMLQRMDDIITAGILGSSALGYYSRAYAFANYPRKLVAIPVHKVMGGTFAELKEDPQKLSQAFFRTSSFLVRAGCLVAGLLAVTASEFIELVLGASWLPMLEAFRWMLLYAAQDPLNTTLASLFNGLGKPRDVIVIRLIQLAAYLPLLLLLGSHFGISGIAMATTIMSVLGVGSLLLQARRYIPFSIRRVFLPPLIATGLAFLASTLLPPALSIWLTGVTKAFAFGLVYLGVMILFEKSQWIAMIKKLAS